MSRIYGRGVPGSLRLLSITRLREPLSRPAGESFRQFWADWASLVTDPPDLAKMLARTDRMSADDQSDHVRLSYSLLSPLSWETWVAG
jgi:hypothetical protein